MKNITKKIATLLVFIAPSIIFAVQPLEYICDNNQSIKVAYPDENHAIMIKGDGDIELFQIAISASGARYISKSLQWWTKGNMANLSALKVESEDSFGIMCEVVTK